MKVKRRRKQAIQEHHISYDPEIIVKIYQGEHWAITVLNRRTKNISKGFLRCLEKFIKSREDIAIDLDEVDNEMPSGIADPRRPPIKKWGRTYC